MVHTYNPSVRGTKAGGLPQSQPELHSETLSRDKEKKTMNVKLEQILTEASVTIVLLP